MIFIDIETLPTESPEVIADIRSGIKAPSNWKDPEKIEKHVDENLDSAVAKTSFSGLHGRVLAIGYAGMNGHARCAYAENAEHEKEILELFSDTVSKMSGINDVSRIQFIGHNINRFDARFLSQRLMIHGLPILHNLSAGKYRQTFIDTMEMFDCFEGKMYSLDNLCKAFGVESPKGDIDGSKIHQAWLDGRHEDIRNYCIRDVEATRELYKRMVAA